MISGILDQIRSKHTSFLFEGIELENIVSIIDRLPSSILIILERGDYPLRSELNEVCPEYKSCEGLYNRVLAEVWRLIKCIRAGIPSSNDLTKSAVLRLLGIGLPDAYHLSDLVVVSQSVTTYASKIRWGTIDDSDNFMMAAFVLSRGGRFFRSRQDLKTFAETEGCQPRMTKLTEILVCSESQTELLGADPTLSIRDQAISSYRCEKISYFELTCLSLVERDSDVGVPPLRGGLIHATDEGEGPWIYIGNRDFFVMVSQIIWSDDLLIEWKDEVGLAAPEDRSCDIENDLTNSSACEIIELSSNIIRNGLTPYLLVE